MYASSGDARARERLVAKYTPLVRRVSNRYSGSRESREDLFQVGIVGLLSAIDKFDARRGTSFTALAFPEVRGAILNHLRGHGSLIKVPRTLQTLRLTVEKASEGIAPRLGRWPTCTEVAEACDLSEEDVEAALKLSRGESARSLDRGIGADDGDSTTTLGDMVGQEDPGYELGLLRMAMRSVLDRLPLRERRIVTLRYYRGLTQRQTAEVVAVSQMHVSGLERGALKKMRLLMGPGGSGEHSPHRPRTWAA